MTTGPLPRMSPKTVGDLQVHALVDAVGPARTASEMLRDLPEGLVEANRSWLTPDYMDQATGRLILSYQSFVIRTKSGVVLVDCAIGEDGNFPSRRDWHHGKSDWLNHLGQAGLAPEDIDIVFLTHLHVDHTGWLTRWIDGQWQPSFPNARHLVSDAELAFWTARHADFAYMESSVPDCVLPVQAAGLFDIVTPGTEVLPGLSVVDLAGHSPGMIGLEYRHEGRLAAAFNADLMHHPLQMTAPQMATAFCHEPDKAVATRRDRLNAYAEAETLMFCGHFPGQSAGYAISEGDGFRFRPAP